MTVQEILRMSGIFPKYKGYHYLERALNILSETKQLFVLSDFATAQAEKERCS